MHPLHLRATANTWHAEGVPFSEICQRLNLPRGTVGKWLHGERSRRPRILSACWRCSEPARDLPHPADYAYLLGQYLGDGHIQRYARAWLLAVACDARYPGLICEIDAALRACGARTTRHVFKKGCVMVQAYSTHWPCLFPQSGPGKKHERSIVLAEWQRDIVAAHPGRFARGLFHSDGCRVMNTVTKGGRLYRYPRYLFANESVDILNLCGEALDLLGVQWRFNRRNSLSVAKREAVSILDAYVGAKR